MPLLLHHQLWVHTKSHSTLIFLHTSQHQVTTYPSMNPLHALKKHKTFRVESCNSKKNPPQVTTYPSFSRAEKVNALLSGFRTFARKSRIIRPVRLLPAGTQGRGQHDGSCVDGLAEALLVDPSCELSDQDRSHPLEAQLLMNTQEFDMRHPLFPVEHFHQRLIWDVCCQNSCSLAVESSAYGRHSSDSW